MNRLVWEEINDQLRELSLIAKAYGKVWGQQCCMASNKPENVLLEK